jgi:hypothetical protein
VIGWWVKCGSVKVRASGSGVGGQLCGKGGAAGITTEERKMGVQAILGVSLYREVASV